MNIFTALVLMTSMNRTLLAIYFLFLFVGKIHATELGLTDTLRVKKSSLAELLLNKNHQAKVACLNNLYAPVYAGLKSFSEGLYLDSIVTTAWSEERQAIEKDRRYTCKFENDGKDVLVDILRWDVTKNKWVVADQNYYYFDDKERLTQIVFREYVNAEYSFYTRIDYVYENNLLRYESRYDRIDEEEFWNELEQLEYIYNEDQTVKVAYLNEWFKTESKWTPKFYEIYGYDSIRNLTAQVGFDYNYFDDLSKKKYEIRHAYIHTNKLAESVEYVPGWQEGIFVPEHKQEYTYTSSWELESEAYYQWNYDFNGWMAQTKLLYSDQLSGMKIYDCTSFVGKDGGQKWRESQRLEFYSENNYVASGIHNWEFLESYLPVSDYNGWVTDKIITSLWSANQWLDAGSIRYYFSDGNHTAIEDVSEQTIKVYPNPVADKLNIVLDDMSEASCIVRNIHGQPVKQQTFQNQVSLDVSDLSSGFYLVEVISKELSVLVEKIVKK